MLKQHTIAIGQSNIAGLGGDADKALRQKAAEQEVNFKGAGDNVGLEVWRIEQFVPKRQSAEKNGFFYSGDSYLVLNTYLNNNKKMYNLHFWLGEESSQDERGAAAYMTVALDDMLGGKPVQYRETQGNESDEFMVLFPKMIIMSGGVASGFNQVKPEEYKPRMLHIKGYKAAVKATECKLSRDSLNQGDSFVVDIGATVYIWQGETTSPFEKVKAAQLGAFIKSERRGKCDIIVITSGDEPDVFWEILGGRGQIKPADDEKQPEPAIRRALWRLNETDKVFTLTEEQNGSLSRDKLDTNDIFFVDTERVMYVWVGSGSSISEKRDCFAYATELLKKEGRPASTNILRVAEGCENASFWKCFSS